MAKNVSHVVESHKSSRYTGGDFYVFGTGSYAAAAAAAVAAAAAGPRFLFTR